MKTNKFMFHTDEHLRKHQLLIKDTFDGWLELVTWNYRVPSDKRLRAFLETIADAEKSGGKYWAHELSDSLADELAFFDYMVSMHMEEGGYSRRDAEKNARFDVESRRSVGTPPWRDAAAIAADAVKAAR
jgi:hypothetical protein